MVIGSSIFSRYLQLTLALGLIVAGGSFRAMAEDQIYKNDGTVISGQVVSVADGQVTIQSTTSRGGIAKVPYPLSDIKSVTMTVPAAVLAVQAQGTTSVAVIAALEPVVKQFAGLPADWVISAMAQLADAYAAQGEADKSTAVYDQIVQLYPGSPYMAVAKAGKAEMSLKAGKIDEALAAVQPMIEQANQNMAPSPSDGAIYAKAFLVYGQVKEKQGQPQDALEAYLTVKTMFYQNAALVAQADQLAQALRDKNPGLGVN
jgi:tetratricopeptide (TPR) repeat protein